MIRFADIVPASKLKQASTPAPGVEPGAPLGTSPVPSDTAKPAKVPRTRKARA